MILSTYMLLKLTNFYTHTLFYLCHGIKMHYMQKQNNDNLRIFVEYVVHEENIQRNIRILNK